MPIPTPITSRPAEPPAEDPHSVRPARELRRTLRVLKHDDTFAVLDEYGDASGSSLNSEGLYHTGTRMMSVCRLSVGGERPLLLGSSLSQDNTVLMVDMANAAAAEVAADTLHIARSLFVWCGSLYQKIKLTNYGSAAVSIEVKLELGADFADVFEVRGEVRQQRGRQQPDRISDGELSASYVGLDDIRRTLRVTIDRHGSRVTDRQMAVMADVAPGREWTLSLRAECNSEEKPIGRVRPGYREAFEIAEASARDRSRRLVSITTSNHQFDAWLARSGADVGLMLSETPSGLYPHAGIPWFSTVFGRDAIVTALETLWLDPSIARGVLGHLAATQASAIDPTRDAEPGKVVHEERLGEMARTGEIPFGRYYGSVDATPLFIHLAGAYHRRTADDETIARLWPSLVAAMGWIDARVEKGGDPYLRYQRAGDNGLINQGWKDSYDSVFHRDGRLATAPIALAEVQAYVHAARQAMAYLARARGDERQAVEQASRAAQLHDSFNGDFWSDRLGMYALAIDRDGMCEVRSSNAGQCLLFDIATPERARQVSRVLLSEAMFSGWGVRTIAEGEIRYNPMSYHNGSVWPHDTALIGAGMAHTGAKWDAIRLLTGMFEASRFFELQRLPELLCGFARQPGRGPTQYPVACSPQAWSAGAVFMLLESCLGLSIDARARRISCDRPQLPPWLDWVAVEGLSVGTARVDLIFRRADTDVSVSVNKSHASGPEPEVVLVKRI